MKRFCLCGSLGLLLVLFPVRAHDAAPPAQLIGVRPCVQTSSVQLVLEEVPLEIDTERVRRAVYDYLLRTLQGAGIAYDDLCPSSDTFALFGVYARFLDPQSYIGFPPSSYTYLTTGQLGRFSPQPTFDTVLTTPLYTTSLSEIFQADGADALSRRLVALGNGQVDDFVKHWLEANAVPPRMYGLFAALGALLAGLRVLPRLVR